MKYKKTPKEVMNVIELFAKNNLNYILFKCEHIFEGENKNLDILFETKEDCDKASELLEREEFLLYMEESVEKYKRMYVKLIDTTLYAVHLHREIAWHGLIALDKRDVFARQNKINEFITVPSPEDSLLIHVCHIIFEDFKISQNQRVVVKKLLTGNIDWEYINRMLNENKIKKQFFEILDKIKQNQQPKYLRLSLTRRILSKPSNWSLIISKIIKILFRKLSLRRRGCLIALIGVNGSGKTTLTRRTLERYKQVTDFFNGQFGYYFGWEPFSFYAKFISTLLRKKGKKIFDELNYKQFSKKQKFDLFKELIFVYNYLEYLQRYLFVIYPKLRKNKLVITDRYFYDIYGQYEYAERSRIVKLLLSTFPRPDYLFVLDADAEAVRKRGKDTKIFSKINKSDKRNVLDMRILDSQISKYRYLNRFLDGRLIDTTENIEKNIERIMSGSWRSFVR